MPLALSRFGTKSTRPEDRNPIFLRDPTLSLNQTLGGAALDQAFDVYTVPANRRFKFHVVQLRIRAAAIAAARGQTFLELYINALNTLKVFKLDLVTNVVGDVVSIFPPVSEYELRATDHISYRVFDNSGAASSQTYEAHIQGVEFDA